MTRNLLLSLLSFVVVSATAQTKLTVTQIKDMLSVKTLGQVSIHDPSVYYDEAGDYFYLIGSHMGQAKSKNLTSFSGINPGSEGKTLFGQSYETAFSSNPTHQVQVTRNGVTTTETLGSFNAGAFCATYSGVKVGDREATTEKQWISGDMWAPDMVYNPNMKKWCMYLSLNGDYWSSVIILLTSDSPTGPFKYQAPIVFGGFDGQTRSGKSVNYKNTDLELVLGEQAALPSRYRTSAWGNLWPNCIDPCVFFDDNGELWMAYGSWSGGIFMLKLDKNTGLRDYTTTYNAVTYTGNNGKYTGYKSDPYFGKLIAGGAYVSGEGAYIEKIGEYYYLFMSYGGFAPDGGYEMRIFRSANPDGPYVDGNGASALFTSYVLNYGKNAASNKGMKIMGAMNNWGTMTVGECAQGHNSAIVDKDGDAFVVYHTKFNDGTFGHLVRTRQLFVNEKGWLVAAPFKHTAKTTTQSLIESTQLFSSEEIVGTYQMLLHPYRLNHNAMAEATPVVITLTADGKITGTRTGTWKYSQEGKSFVTLTINGSTYYGVTLEQNVDDYKNMPALCMTAVSQAGVPVWLYKFQPAAAVASAYPKHITEYLGTSSTVISGNAPTVANVNHIYTTTNYDTKLPEQETLSEDGIFTPTEDGHKIRINIELPCGDYYYSAGPFVRVTAKSDGTPSIPVCYPESTTKNTTAGWWSNFSKENYKLEQGNAIEFQFYNYSNKAENWKNWCLYGASTTHGVSGYSEYFGIRCDNWDNTSASNTGCVSDFDFGTFKSDMDGSLVKMVVSYDTDGTFTMKSTITSTAGKVNNYSYTKTIASKPADITLFFVSEGSYIDGSKLATGVNAVSVSKKSVNNGKIYNLAGQEAGDNYRGIVVVNGKAMVK